MHVYQIYPCNEVNSSAILYKILITKCLSYRTAILYSGYAWNIVYECGVLKAQFQRGFEKREKKIDTWCSLPLV